MTEKKITTYNEATLQDAKNAKLLGNVGGTTKLINASDLQPDLSNYVQKSNTSGLLKNDGTIDTNIYLTQHQDISGKQDVINDLSDIRANAALGASALQEHQTLKTINNQSLIGEGNITIEVGGNTDLTGYATQEWVSQQGFLTQHQDISGKANASDLASVATSGNYNDLSNKPTIPNAYTKQEADDRFLKGTSDVVNLPSEYEQVCNLKTTGEQYIDTGYTPNPSTFGFYIDIKPEDSITTSNSAHIFVAGRRNDSANKRVALTMYAKTPGGELRLGDSIDKNPRLNKNQHTTLQVIDKAITYPNGTTQNITTEIENVNCTTTLYLFALNDNGTMQRFTNCELFRFAIYEGTTLIKDFVPVRRKADGKLGLYELVGTYQNESDRFFTNQGSGADFTTDDTISGLGDLINNTTLVSDATYVHTDNNFTSAFKTSLTTLTTKVPNAPTTDGTYVLTAIVTNGVAIYSWVAQ